MEKELHGKELLELAIQQVQEDIKSGKIVVRNKHWISSDDIAYQEWCEFYETENKGVEENGL